MPLMRLSAKAGVDSSMVTANTPTVPVILQGCFIVEIYADGVISALTGINFENSKIAVLPPSAHRTKCVRDWSCGGGNRRRWNAVRIRPRSRT